jgi:ferredoxin
MPAEPSLPHVPVLLLICEDLADAGLDPVGLASFVRTRWPQISTDVRPGLCNDPQRVASSVAAVNPTTLVLALCNQWSIEGEMEEQARRGGLNPLALSVVPLATVCRGDFSPVDKARGVITSLLLRALAFPGARPDNLKPTRRRHKSTRNRRDLFVLPPVTYRPVPTFDRTLCTAPDGCAQCGSACPVQAIRSTGRGIDLDRDACSGCGLCLLACPQRAVEMPGWSPPELEAQLGSLLAEEPARPVVFFCHTTPPPGGPWMPVQVRCTAGVPSAAIVGLLANGIPAVALTICGEGCDGSQGSRAGTRVNFVRALLEAIGENPGRVQSFRSTDNSFEDVSPAPLPGASPGTLLQVFGAGADSAAVLALAELLGVGSAHIEHAGSPLGLVSLEPGTCTTCGSCASACPTGALTFQQTSDDVSLAFDPRRCTACGDCIPVCPERERSAIRLQHIVDIGELARGQRQVAREALGGCRRCGGPVASRAVLERIGALLGDDYRPEVMADLCLGCRQGF